MRDRRPLMGHGAAKAMATIDEDEDKVRGRPSCENPDSLTIAKGILSRVSFFILILGLPLGVIYYYTPFFVLEGLQCRFLGKVWSDDMVNGMEERYHRYAASPPRFLSLEYNKTMLWGTYEPGMLFAMKTRTPKPVYIGIAWYDEAGLHPVRYRLADVLSMQRRHGSTDDETAKTNNIIKKSKKLDISDEKWDLFEAFWAVHDGTHYGRQVIQDGPRTVNIEFLKSPSGDSWHVRVHGHMNGAQPIRLLVYVVNDGGDPILPMESEGTMGLWNPQVKSEFKDADERQESFSLLVKDNHNPFLESPLWQVHGWRISGDEFIRNADLRNLPSGAHNYFPASSVLERWQYPKTSSVSHNVMVFQKYLESDFRLELSMRRRVSDFATLGQDATRQGEFVANETELTSCQLTNAFRLREKEVLQRMRALVTPWARGFSVNRKTFVNRARRALSGALGSWGYWHGRYLHVDASIDSAWDDQGRAVTVKPEEHFREVARDVSAFGAVTSRTEGAYGDVTLSGMQLLFLIQWNKEWTKEVLASWLVGALDMSSGFLPRHATFTPAARFFAPPSARYEHLTFAAPPTLLLALHQLLQNDKGVNAEKDFFKVVLPPLHRWRAWFHSTQSTRNDAMSLEALAAMVNNTDGKEYVPPMYRWRSRDEFRIPASGMPDYPRPVCTGHHKLEAHLDLFSWVAFLNIIISEMELHLGHPESVPKFLWKEWLDKVHWDAAHERYADRLGCPDIPFSPYVGYANLFPFILGILDNKEKALASMSLAELQLMTPYGLMSVSYESIAAAREAGLRHDNRWMGSVWVSTNALMLHALQMKYIDLLGAPAEEFFRRLRLSIVKAANPTQRISEAFSPVTGDPEGNVSLIGHRTLLLVLLKSYI